MKPIARIIFSLILLWEVWHHSHWSVAVCITLLFIGTELRMWVDKIESQRIDKMTEKFVNDIKRTSDPIK